MKSNMMKLPDFSDEQKKLRAVISQFNKPSSILDIGCGYGRNLIFLSELGFTNLTGVEKNSELREYVSNQGYKCLSPDEIEAESGKYGLLLMSHIIEHFECGDLKEFLEYYLGLLSDDGFLLIVTPLLHSNFYNDFDHVKPYLPIGFNMVFGRDSAQVQFQSPFILDLVNIKFYRQPYQIQFHPSIYLKNTHAWPIYVNRILKLLFFMTRGFLGKKIGWIGLYKLHGKREGIN